MHRQQQGEAHGDFSIEFGLVVREVPFVFLTQRRVWLVTAEHLVFGGHRVRGANVGAQAVNERGGLGVAGGAGQGLVGQPFVNEPYEGLGSAKARDGGRVSELFQCGDVTGLAVETRVGGW